VSVVGPVEARPADDLAVDFVVEAHRAQLGKMVQRVQDGKDDHPRSPVRTWHTWISDQRSGKLRHSASGESRT
jgi:hypothetical protein